MTKRFVKIVLSYIIVSTFLYSCDISYKIQVHNDSSATVELLYNVSYDNDYINYLNRIQNSNIISNVSIQIDSSLSENIEDYAAFPISFKINSIDSLGNYLFYLRQGFFTFSNNENEFSILTSGDAQPFIGYRQNGPDMLFEFEREISDIISNQIKVKKVGENEVVIKENRKILRNKGRPAKIIIILKE